MVGCPEAVGGRDTPHALGAVVFFGRVGGDLVGHGLDLVGGGGPGELRHNGRPFRLFLFAGQRDSLTTQKRGVSPLTRSQRGNTPFFCFVASSH